MSLFLARRIWPFPVVEGNLESGKLFFSPGPVMVLFSWRLPNRIAPLKVHFLLYRTYLLVLEGILVKEPNELHVNILYYCSGSTMGSYRHLKRPAEDFPGMNNLVCHFVLWNCDVWIRVGFIHKSLLEANRIKSSPSLQLGYCKLYHSQSWLQSGNRFRRGLGVAGQVYIRHFTSQLHSLLCSKWEHLHMHMLTVQ